MENCKLQIGCLLIVLYIVFIYYRDKKRIPLGERHFFYEALLITGVISLVLDTATAYTVNHLETVNPVLNMILHCLFLLGIDTVIFTLALYILSVTEGLPSSKWGRAALAIPFLINILVVIGNIYTLEYRQGQQSNYSMRISAYTCFIMAAVYMIFSLLVFLRGWNYIEKRKRVGIFTCLFVLVCVTIYQMIVPQSLVTSIAITMIILGAYMNQEDPAMQELSHYHDEMVMGFATLVENRDNNTGGHIQRTTRYVQLLMTELRARGHYRDILTKDYMKNLMKAAPMHDLGKVAIPDAILQKPGKLTNTEFALMKTHTVKGGQIIQETFGRMGDPQFLDLAYQIALHHHEKWNGRGYPDGLRETEIPLGARIMAIADVFDAVSEDRCYRKALPLDACFRIIEEGSGSDFDPLLAGIFLEIRDKVEKVYREIN